MRSYIRHSASMPITIESSQRGCQTKNLHNVSAGGFCFYSDYYFPQGISININVLNLEHPFAENCTVSWCKKTDDHYNVGVSFDSFQTVFRVRMIEQLCYIEDYRNQVLNNEDRQITPEEASQEWIDKFSDRIFKI